MTGKIIFPIIASLLPVIVSDLLQESLGIGSESSIILILSGFVSFVLLVMVQVLLENVGRLFSNKNKYCGHWIEEMTLYQKNSQGTDCPVKRMIGIGIIRYDRKTGEYVFDGNTYDLDGNERYAWTIDYLHSSRDDSMQYVCSVQIPGERSIGQITFDSKNECDGTIWVMNGEWYKFSGHRIKLKELYQFGVEPPLRAKLRSFYRGMMMEQQDIPKFVRSYSEKNFLRFRVEESVE